ncbi:MAG: hypothetical protein ACR2OY_05535 [Boseongicola sp.]
MPGKEVLLQNILIWACVYPCALAFSYGLGWFGANFPLWVEILISTVFTVPFISLVACPLIENIMDTWRYSAKSDTGYSPHD